MGPIVGETIYKFSPENILRYSGLAVIVIALVSMYLLRFVKTRYKSVHEELKTTSVFAKPVLLPGLIFMLGMGTYVGFVQFASIFARNVGINDSSTFYLIISNGIFYPALVLCALRRATSHDKSTILGSLGVFFDTAFGILPIFLGYIASQLSYSYMFVIVSVCSIAGVSLVSSMRLPKGAETIEV